MKPSAAVALAALVALAGLAGCDFQLNDGRKATLTYTEDARAAYTEAMASFRAKDWEDARALFLELKQRFAYSRYARLAELRIADIDFEQEKYSDAISAYREFVQEHRADPNAEYAKYKLAKSLYLDINDTVFLPPAEERDQATTIDAYKELKSFLRQFPATQYRRDATFMLEVVTGRLVRHELYVARYYLKEDVFEAAVARIDYALQSFPGSGLDPEALVLKGETLLKMKKRDEARAAFETVIRSYGGPFAITARRFLDQMGVRSAAPAGPTSRPSPSGPQP